MDNFGVPLPSGWEVRLSLEQFVKISNKIVMFEAFSQIYCTC